MLRPLASRTCHYQRDSVLPLHNRLNVGAHFTKCQQKIRKPRKNGPQHLVDTGVAQI